MLESIVQQYGAKDWSTVSIQMAKRGSHRQGKQCRERYHYPMEGLFISNQSNSDGTTI